MVKHTQTICWQLADNLFECVWPICLNNTLTGTSMIIKIEQTFYLAKALTGAVLQRCSSKKVFGKFTGEYSGKKPANTELFLVRNFLYSVQIQENTD